MAVKSVTSIEKPLIPFTLDDIFHILFCHLMLIVLFDMLMNMSRTVHTLHSDKMLIFKFAILYHGNLVFFKFGINAMRNLLNKHLKQQIPPIKHT